MSDSMTVMRFLERRQREKDALVQARRERMLSVLPTLVSALVARGARRVWLFGSLVWGGVHQRSDTDLAVEGLSAEDLLCAQGELLLQASSDVDLVRVEEAPPALADRIRATGRLLHG